MIRVLGCISPGAFASRSRVRACVRVLTSDRSSNKMPAGVRAALVDIAQEEGEMGEEEARAYVARLEREERLFEECWS
jgi:hypothetical protein